MLPCCDITMQVPRSWEELLVLATHMHELALDSQWKITNPDRHEGTLLALHSRVGVPSGCVNVSNFTKCFVRAFPSRIRTFMRIVVQNWHHQQDSYQRLGIPLFWNGLDHLIGSFNICTEIHFHCRMGVGRGYFNFSRQDALHTLTPCWNI